MVPTTSSSSFPPTTASDMGQFQRQRRTSETTTTMPSRSPRRPGPLPSASRRRKGAAEPPPGLFPAREDLLRLLAVLAIASAAAAACSGLHRRPEPFCDSVQSPDDYADDSCQPCPQNGRCVDGQLECVQGFKRYGGSCIEDGLLSQTAAKISELLQLRICDQHARTLCGQPAKILFQKHDVSDTVDQLLSKNPAGLTEDGIQLVKARVLDTAQGFFETSFTSNQAEAFKCPELVAECHMPLTCQVRHWISRNIIFVASFSILHCSGDCAPFTRDKHYQIELRKYMNRCVKPLKIML
ncbi:hypothetical protein PVAP13_9NG833900 [Panicum virgatum]|uniref:Uncharacterized protein n=3 Tax=Panicum virgatum TaxID=38727 RepID=A0A8T0NB95_PANVG|nr:hypothetical protein PVAP13_9NG833900 [Panicum virgatum]